MAHHGGMLSCNTSAKACLYSRVLILSAHLNQTSFRKADVMVSQCESGTAFDTYTLA
jgi:hypothetical protein